MPGTKKTVTKAQRALLDRWTPAPKKLLIRWPGGYWTLEGTDPIPRTLSLDFHDRPEWYVSTGTVRALAKAGRITMLDDSKAKLETH